MRRTPGFVGDTSDWSAADPDAEVRRTDCYLPVVAVVHYDTVPSNLLDVHAHMPDKAAARVAKEYTSFPLMDLVCRIRQNLPSSEQRSLQVEDRSVSTVENPQTNSAWVDRTRLVLVDNRSVLPSGRAKRLFRVAFDNAYLQTTGCASVLDDDPMDQDHTGQAASILDRPSRPVPLALASTPAEDSLHWRGTTFCCDQTVFSPILVSPRLD